MRKLKKDYKITILTIILILGCLVLTTNIFLLDLTGKTFFAETDFHSMKGVLITDETDYPQRGTITDSEGNILAHDVTVYKIAFILSPTHQKYDVDENGNTVLVDDYVKDADLTASLIAPILNADENYLRERLGEKDYYQVEIGTYGSNLSYDIKNEIEALNLPGIVFESSTSRYYPYNTFASHLIGYVENQKEDSSYHLVGISGIEGVFDKELSGTAGHKEYYSDVNGNPLAGGSITIQQSVDGYNIKLTLNNIIQQALEEALQNTMNISSSVDKAWGIVMDAKDGKILGYSSYPSFNPNEMNIEDYNDYCATLPYEPGSTIKSFVYAAAVDVGTFNQDDHFDGRTYYVDGNYKDEIHRVQYDNGLGIHNYLDEQISNASFYEAYCCSYNVGCAVLLEKYIDPQVYMDYMDKFGFYKPVNVYGIDEGEFYGSADYSNAYSIVSTSFGQGMSATALQVIQAYTAFTNKGIMVKPYIIDEITDSNTGNVIYKGQKTEVGNPVSESTAEKMLELMSGVVNSGWSITSAKYKIPQVDVGGKSGTAEVALAEGGYGNLTIHSMMLAMPIDDPQVLIYFCYQDENPRTSQSIPYINELEQKVAQVLGLSKTNQQENDENREVYDSAMGNYINHSLEYVKRVTDKFDIEKIIIGDGDTVIGQYPAEGISLISKQKIFLLTSSVSYTMPDMNGWSRKEIQAFANLTGLKINIQGYGFAVSQNVEVGQIIEENTIIEIQLQ